MCIHLEGRRLFTSVYDKRDAFKFCVINYSHLDSNILTKPAYGVYVSLECVGYVIDMQILKTDISCSLVDYLSKDIDMTIYVLHLRDFITSMRTFL